MSEDQARAGFNWLSALLVLVIIGLCAGIGTGFIYRTRLADDRVRTLNQISQVGKAVHVCNDAYKKLPPGIGSIGGRQASLFYHLLPFLGVGGTSDPETGPTWLDNPSEAAKHEIFFFASPLDPQFQNPYLNGLAITNFAGNSRIFSLDGKQGRYPNVFMPAGPENVVMFATVAARVDETSGHCWGATEGSYVPLLTDFELPTSGRHGDEHQYQRAAMLDGEVVYICLGDASARTLLPVQINEHSAKITNPTPPWRGNGWEGK